MISSRYFVYFFGLIYFASVSVFANDLLVRYGDRKIDLAEFIGLGWSNNFMVNEKTDDIFWLYDGMDGVEIRKLKKTGERYTEIGQPLFDNWGKRTIIQPRYKYHEKTDAIYLTTDLHNDENYNIFKYSTKERKLRKLTSLGYAHAFSMTDDYLYYLGRDNKFKGKICLRRQKVNALWPREKILICDEPALQMYFFTAPLIDPDDQFAAIFVAEKGLRTNGNIGIYDIKSKTFSTVFPRQDGIYARALGWHGQKLYVASNYKVKTPSLYSYNAITKELKLVRESNGSAIYGFYSPKLKVFVVEERSNSGVLFHIFDPETDTVVRTEDGEGLQIDTAHWEQTKSDGTFVLSMTSRKDLFRRIATIDPKAPQRKMIKEIFIPEIEKKLKTSCVAEDHYYETFDKDNSGQVRKIHGILFKPIGRQSSKAILMPHGGPSAQTTKAHNVYTQSLCEAGYTIFGPNVRGSTGYGTEFENLNNGDWGGGDHRDYIYGRKYLAGLLNLSDSDIGILGASYGGYMTSQPCIDDTRIRGSLSHEKCLLALAKNLNDSEPQVSITA